MFISVCASVQLSLLLSPLLTLFNIHWLSSSNPSLLSYLFLIPKLPSFPSTSTSHLNSIFPLSPSQPNLYNDSSFRTMKIDPFSNIQPRYWNSSNNWSS
jgi:hypothetical protein